MSDFPKVFISYSWDNDPHKSWVAELATKLRRDGVNACLDQWAAVPGDQLPSFMEREIRENKFVLIICTPNYKIKSDQRQGGVGYEGDIMTAEVLTTKNDRKFIPILKEGSKENSLPSWLLGKYYIDLSRKDRFEEQYNDLLTPLHDKRMAAPPIGKAPDFMKSVPRKLQVVSTSEPLKIEGIVADEVTEPTLDGTPGSGLYKIPFKLNKTPSDVWEEFFLNEWDHPPRFTLMHRPGIASVYGNKIILDGTTIDEVKRYHRDTLVLCVEEANKKEQEYLRKLNAEEERRRQKTEQHKNQIIKTIDEIEF